MHIIQLKTKIWIEEKKPEMKRKSWKDLSDGTERGRRWNPVRLWGRRPHYICEILQPHPHKNPKTNGKINEKTLKKKANKQTNRWYIPTDRHRISAEINKRRAHTHKHAHTLGPFSFVFGVPGAVQFYLPFPPSGAPLTPTIGGLVARLSPGGAGSGGLCPKISAAKSLFFSICSLFFFNVLSLKF